MERAHQQGTSAFKEGEAVERKVTFVLEIEFGEK